MNEKSMDKLKFAKRRICKMTPPATATTKPTSKSGIGLARTR
jgi:hypothetical protein